MPGPKEENKVTKTAWRWILESEGLEPATDENGQPLNAEEAKKVVNSKIPKEKPYNILYVGRKKSGKTSLVRYYKSSINQKNKADEGNPEDTVALEYSAASKQINDLMYVVNLWELESSLDLKILLPTVINADNLDKLCVVFVIDISRPKSSFKELIKWIREIQSQIKEAKKSISVGGGESKGEGNDKWFGVERVIIGSFLDECKTFTKDQMNTIIDSFRYVANHYGTHILFTNPSNKQTMENYVELMDSISFGLNKNKIKCCVNENLLITRDSAEYEGFVKVIQEKFGQDTKKWLDNLNTMFSDLKERNDEEVLIDKSDEPPSNAAQEVERNVEERIDKLRKQKEEDLKEYIHEEERQERLEMKNMLGDDK